MTREDARRHQRLLEAIRAIPVSLKDGWFRFSITALIGLFGVAVLLYLGRPDVEPIDVFVSCPICDRGGPFLAPPDVESANAGATFNVKIQNSGQLGTTLLEHNVTFREQPGGLPKDFDFAETRCPDDNIAIPLGSHSVATLSIVRGDVIVFGMRNPQKIQPIPTYLYGHIKYRGAFGLPTTRYFCFLYHPPVKGLPEQWGVYPR